MWERRRVCAKRAACTLWWAEVGLAEQRRWTPGWSWEVNPLVHKGAERGVQAESDPMLRPRSKITNAS